MDKSNKTQVLKKCPLFQNLNDQQLSMSEKMCTSEVFEPGAIICKQDKKSGMLAFDI